MPVSVRRSSKCFEGKDETNYFGIKKADSCDRIGFLKKLFGYELSHCAQSVVQTALAAGSFIFVDQAFSNRRVDNRHGCFESRLSLFFIARSDGSYDFFDESTQVAALSGIANTASLCLTRSFFSLW
jgi:hypothetical protein